MKVSVWLANAGNIHQTIAREQKAGNGSKKNTMAQATTLNKLQHAIGSNHGIDRVAYNEARKSLEKCM